MKKPNKSNTSKSSEDNKTLDIHEIEHVELRTTIGKVLTNFEEFNLICNDLGIPSDDIEGKTISLKISNLIKYMERRSQDGGREKLLTSLQKAFPEFSHNEEKPKTKRWYKQSLIWVSIFIVAFMLWLLGSIQRPNTNGLNLLPPQPTTSVAINSAVILGNKPTPTLTPSPALTLPATATSTPTAIPTKTQTYTITPTETTTPMATPTKTPTAIPTKTPTNTPIPTETFTSTRESSNGTNGGGTNGGDTDDGGGDDDNTSPVVTPTDRPLG